MASNSTDTVSPITLTPPDPVPVVAPTQAAGLVPVADDTKSKLEARAEAFVADLIAQDAASPEFGKRVD
ncbi:MAG: toxic anion resistance protein, partial [Novosphingobium sp.]|nr:toxic anion resistance protein [Novosphingobium sp.]